MPHPTRRLVVAVWRSCFVALVVWGAPLARAESISVLRDDFGVPHIFAETEAGAAFALGYCQAEDRLVQVLRQYRLATGRMAEVLGSALVEHDYRQRLWRHAEISRERYPELSADGRARIEAFVAGVRRYMDEHPDQVPPWGEPPEPWQVVALSRMIIWGWPEGTAADDLERAGVKVDRPEPRGSNQWLVAAPRSALGVPLALIDPHLSFYGPFRFYEARMYAGADYALSGVAIAGLPEISLGHNQYLSVAMTTGGPDTADVYEEEVHPNDPRQYRYDGAWQTMTVREIEIGVRGEIGVQPVKFTIEETRHGPVVARRPGKAYVMRLAYQDEIALVDQSHAMFTARNVDEFRAALASLQLMEQNVMCATVDGETFYLRNGRVPRRPAGTDSRQPLAGNTSASEWQGLHPIDDLLSLRNPEQGYMQNCNCAPVFMQFDCPLTPERYAHAPYLYHADEPLLHPRAAGVRDALASDPQVTLDEAFEIALDTRAWGADWWQARLSRAWGAAAPDDRAHAPSAQLAALIAGWNGRCDADSPAAIGYKYWKQELGPEVLSADRRAQPPPPGLSEGDLVAALKRAADKLLTDHGRLDVPFGEVYRIGRMTEDPVGQPAGPPAETWPAAGGSLEGLATPRATNFAPLPDGKQFVARSGQTSPQIVVLTRPPQSYTLLPLGQSDDPQSPHYDDQAEKLYPARRMKPTYFLDREGLAPHVEREQVLEWNAN